MSVSDDSPDDRTDAGLLRSVEQAIRGARSEGIAPLAVGVAVSGGGDSMALLHLMERAARRSGQQIRAVTVDHGLRAGSAAEAAMVAGFCAQIGVPHDTLHWNGAGAVGNLMDQARRARAQLIGQWAVAHGVGHVVLGHTADDQAESFLMNLSRAAGLDGLSGMRSRWASEGIVWSRPLLAHSREVLRAYLRRQGVAWVEDPSNSNDRFARVKARRAMEALRPLGITVERLNITIANLSVTQEAVAATTAKAAEAVVERAGGLEFGRQVVLQHPAEIRRRLVIEMIRWMNGRDYPPREGQVQQVLQSLEDRQDATLGGVRFRVVKDDVRVVREARAVGPAVPLGAIWDGRWQVKGPESGQERASLSDCVQVRALGAKGLGQMPDWRAAGIARDAALVTPGVWDGDRLISAPVLGFGKEYAATLTAGFGLFLLSH